jgi:hypothetical protein
MKKHSINKDEQFKSRRGVFGLVCGEFSELVVSRGFFADRRVDRGNSETS